MNRRLFAALLFCALPASAAKVEVAPLDAVPAAPVPVAAPAAIAPLSATPLALSVSAAPSAPVPLAAPVAAPSAPVFGRRTTPPGAAAPAEADARPAASAREQLAALALGLGEANRPGAAADESRGALSRFWDLVRDRRSDEREAFLQGRLDSAKSFLRASLDDPAISGRVADAIAAHKVVAPDLDADRGRILARLKTALDGGRTIRLAKPSEAWDLGSGTLAAAVTYPDGRVEVQVHPRSEVLARAPPALLAATLLHELVHAEFDLGEHAAYFVETAYWAKVSRLAPALAADPDAAVLETLKRDVMSGTLSQAVVASYGKKLKNNPDDLAAQRRLEERGKARVAAVLDELSRLEAAGRWSALDDKPGWLASRLPREDDRRLYFSLMESVSASLPAGTPLSAAFAAAAARARAH